MFAENKSGEAFCDDTLIDLVKTLKYKPRWGVYVKYEPEIDGSGGWALSIVSCTENSMAEGVEIRVRHKFLIPAARYKRNVWAAWLFERYRDVETHEAGEFFKLSGVREFAPHHSNGEDPYLVWHMGDYAQARKRAGDE